MTAITLNSVSSGYADKQVVSDISFEIETAEFFCIIGSNGSGKTTLLKTISQSLKPSKGEIQIFGQQASTYSKRQLSKLVAMVTQTVPSDIPFTVKEVVMMGRYPYLGILGVEKSQDQDIAASAMAFTNISHLADSKIGEISGGERQRAFIARAICQEPQIILLDEPTTALDLAHQVAVMDLMEKLKIEKKITIVMISHDINLAAMYGDRMLLLKHGKIIHMGTPNEILTYDILENAYNCVLMVEKNPLGDFPQVSLVPRRLISQSKLKKATQIL